MSTICPKMQISRVSVCIPNFHCSEARSQPHKILAEMTHPWKQHQNWLNISGTTSVLHFPQIQITIQTFVTAFLPGSTWWRYFRNFDVRQNFEEESDIELDIGPAKIFLLANLLAFTVNFSMIIFWFLFEVLFRKPKGCLDEHGQECYQCWASSLNQHIQF